jgi:hypothetical protein
MEKDAGGEERMETLKEATIARQAKLVIQLLSLSSALLWQAAC